MTRGPDPEHSDQEILWLFVVSPDPVLFASEIAESLDMTRQGVYKRMESLVESGLVHTKKSGQRTRVYWISRRGRRLYSELATSGDEPDSGSQ